MAYFEKLLEEMPARCRAILDASTSTSPIDTSKLVLSKRCHVVLSWHLRYITRAYFTILMPPTVIYITEGVEMA